MLTQNIKMHNKNVLITGAAGFIGSNLVMELIRTVPNINIVGLDNMNDYYDVSLRIIVLAKSKRLPQSIPTAHGSSFVAILLTVS